MEKRERKGCLDLVQTLAELCENVHVNFTENCEKVVRRYNFWRIQ